MGAQMMESKLLNPNPTLPCSDLYIALPQNRTLTQQVYGCTVYTLQELFRQPVSTHSGVWVINGHVPIYFPFWLRCHDTGMSSFNPSDNQTDPIFLALFQDFFLYVFYEHVFLQQPLKNIVSSGMFVQRGRRSLDSLILVLVDKWGVESDIVLTF